MTYEQLKKVAASVAAKYGITRVTLFGSRASGKCRDDSDVDLIVEFSHPVSLLTLANLSIELEQMLCLKVDIIHGPLREDDIIEATDQVVIYAA